MRNNLVRLTAIGSALSSVLMVGAAGAADYSTILTGLDASSAETAIVGAAAILALVGFAKWGAKKVGRFFG